MIHLMRFWTKIIFFPADNQKNEKYNENLKANLFFDILSYFLLQISILSKFFVLLGKLKNFSH